MTESTLPLAELLAKAGDGDFLRSVAEAVVQLLMETDVEGLIGAGRHERRAERATYRNGYRDRTLDVGPSGLRHKDRLRPAVRDRPKVGHPSRRTRAGRCVFAGACGRAPAAGYHRKRSSAPSGWWRSVIRAAVSATRPGG